MLGNQWSCGRAFAGASIREDILGQAYDNLINKLSIVILCLSDLVAYPYAG